MLGKLLVGMYLLSILAAALTGYDEVIEETALHRRAEVMARDRMKE